MNNESLWIAHRNLARWYHIGYMNGVLRIALHPAVVSLLAYEDVNPSWFALHCKKDFFAPYATPLIDGFEEVMHLKTDGDWGIYGCMKFDKQDVDGWQYYHIAMPVEWGDSPDLTYYRLTEITVTLYFLFHCCQRCEYSKLAAPGEVVQLFMVNGWEIEGGWGRAGLWCQLAPCVQEWIRNGPQGEVVQTVSIAMENIYTQLTGKDPRYTVHFNWRHNGVISFHADTGDCSFGTSDQKPENAYPHNVDTFIQQMVLFVGFLQFIECFEKEPTPV